MTAVLHDNMRRALAGVATALVLIGLGAVAWGVASAGGANPDLQPQLARADRELRAVGSERDDAREQLAAARSASQRAQTARRRADTRTRALRRQRARLAARLGRAEHRVKVWRARARRAR